MRLSSPLCPSVGMRKLLTDEVVPLMRPTSNHRPSIFFVSILLSFSFSLSSEEMPFSDVVVSDVVVSDVGGVLAAVVGTSGLTMASALMRAADANVERGSLASASRLSSFFVSSSVLTSSLMETSFSSEEDSSSVFFEGDPCSIGSSTASVDFSVAAGDSAASGAGAAGAAGAGAVSGTALLALLAPESTSIGVGALSAGSAASAGAAVDGTGVASAAAAAAAAEAGWLVGAVSSIS